MNLARDTHGPRVVSPSMPVQSPTLAGVNLWICVIYLVSQMWTVTAGVVSPFSTTSLTEGAPLSMQSTWSTQTATGTGIRAPAWFASSGESHSNTPSRVPPGVQLIRRISCFLSRSIDTHRSYKAVRTVLRQSSTATSGGTGHRCTRKTMRPLLLLLSETPPETQTFDRGKRRGTPARERRTAHANCRSLLPAHSGNAGHGMEDVRDARTA